MRRPGREPVGPEREPVGPRDDERHVGRAAGSSPEKADLGRARELARVMDRAVRIPGTQIWLGLDAVIGLVPGFGDVAGVLVSAYPLWVGARMKVGGPVLARMLLNVGVDAVVGAIPLLGDVFDVGWKANTRNVALLDAWAGDPARTRSSSRAVLVGVIAGVLVRVVSLVWTVLAVGGWVLGGGS